jgi:hypothetical protein
MVQIPGTVAGSERGVTTIEQHERTTWAPATAGGTAASIPLLTDYSAIIAYMKSIRDKRKEN